MYKAPILKACNALGSQSALARALGKRQSVVASWIKRERIPAEHVLMVETVSGVPRHELRPDLYPRDNKNNVGNSGVGQAVG